MQNEVQILRQAMLNEVEGAEFYKISAEKFAPSGTKEALLDLASQEESHIEYLRSLSEKILDDSKEINFDPEDLKKEVPSPGIFNWDKIDEDLVRLAVTVFSVGLNMEKDSVKFYEEAKDKVENEDSKKLFDILVKWEQSHVDTLQKQYEIYQQEWWNMQNFEPF
ncbi:MAG: ferritin family protein [Peptoniphilus sp.]|nr:ferritin family protein [Peptoniphilus sp.]MDD7363760.1 ferritin family protein [Bacillota bacterium]MDY6044601.1 ferritin family protein [Peptoniphilus sp.]